VADVLNDERATLDLTVTDRRRPGRADFENGHLITLLRDQPTIAPFATAEVDVVAKARWTDDLSLARGILIGLPIGVTMWAAIIFAVWHLI
jgi:hypothetical protein